LVGQVNDDYCDCQDGSDEPGTCKIILVVHICSPSSLCCAAACSNGQFYCTNEGFRGQYIPSSRVVDGVCDCCDGSDEELAKKQCINTCDEAGAAWRVAEAERIRVAEAGAKAKLDYIKQAQAALDDAEGAKAKLTAQRDAAKDKVAEAEGELETAKAQADANALQQHSNDAREVLKALDLAGSSADDLGAILVQLARTVKGGAPALTKLAETAALKRGVEEKNIGHIVWPMDVSEDAASAKDPGLKAAEASVAAAKSDQSEAQKALDALQDKQGKDYGPQNAFFPLDGKCVDFKQAQYTYHVCPYGSAKQDHTLLGNFEGFGENFSTMRFTNGQTCWNGPARSMTVKLVCGAEETLSSVDEPSKCEYTATLTTPAVCDDRFAKPIDVELVKDEL